MLPWSSDADFSLDQQGSGCGAKARPGVSRFGAVP
jgi:hypothetical protein